MACCSFDQSVDCQFGAAKARKELERYRRRGAGPTARMLLDGLSHVAISGETVLDIGGGVGALTFELLARGGRRATIVEASAAYAETASAEAGRRGQSAAVQVVRGDFLDAAAGLPPAGVVALDRVVCCYPLYARLLGEALAHADRVFAYSYPRDRWYVRAVVGLENLLRRRKNSFQTFVHPATAMQGLIEGAGFERIHHAHTLAWAADVFVRRP